VEGYRNRRRFGNIAESLWMFTSAREKAFKGMKYKSFVLKVRVDGG
jgi:hypothetical protein